MGRAHRPEARSCNRANRFAKAAVAWAVSGPKWHGPSNKPANQWAGPLRGPNSASLVHRPVLPHARSCLFVCVRVLRVSALANSIVVASLSSISSLVSRPHSPELPPFVIVPARPRRRRRRRRRANGDTPPSSFVCCCLPSPSPDHITSHPGAFPLFNSQISLLLEVKVRAPRIELELG
ncbi:hypothetical protein NL676_036514 [Syzygium grande]|nr:hypothetical protein NL676_036514 [Syzygium grande]